MTKENTGQNQIEFIYKWIRQTRSPWDSDVYRICWYFDHESKNYIYEHKNELLQTNGFSISKTLSELIPDELKKRYFEASERGFIFSVFADEITNYIFDDINITEEDFVNTFGLPKLTYFDEVSFEAWHNLI